MSVAARCPLRSASLPRGFAVVATALALLMAAPARADTTDRAGPGPFSAQLRTLPAFALNGSWQPGAPPQTVATDLYCPEPARAHRDVAVRPLVTLLVDAGDSPEHVAGTAKHLASYGLVVTVPRLDGKDAPERARQVLAMGDALALRGGVVSARPLLQCLAQQELRPWVLVAHGSAASVVLALEKQREDLRDHLPQVVWLGPVVARAELEPSMPRSAMMVGPAEVVEQPPGRHPPELVVLTETESCDGSGRGLFESTRLHYARVAVTVEGASHCSLVEPGNPSCPARCGAGSGRARAAARRALTAWLLELTQTDKAYATRLRAMVAELDGLEEVEQRPQIPLPAPYQFSASLLLGAGVGLQGADLPSAGFAVGARPAFVYGRSYDSYFGIGPYGEVLTAGFDDVQLGGGVEAVVPIYAGFVVAPSGGAFGWHREDLGWEPALSGGGFIGYRGGADGNFLDPAFGARIDARVGLGDRGDQALLVTFQGDVISALAGVAAVVAWAL